MRSMRNPGRRMLMNALSRMMNDRVAERGLRPMDKMPDYPPVWVVDENGIGDIGHVSDVGLDFGQRHISTSNSEGHDISDSAQGWLPLTPLLQERWAMLARPYRTPPETLATRDARARRVGAYMHDIDRENRNLAGMQKARLAAKLRYDDDFAELMTDAIIAWYKRMKGRD